MEFISTEAPDQSTEEAKLVFLNSAEACSVRKSFALRYPNPDACVSFLQSIAPMSHIIALLRRPLCTKCQKSSLLSSALLRILLLILQGGLDASSRVTCSLHHPQISQFDWFCHC